MKNLILLLVSPIGIAAASTPQRQPAFHMDMLIPDAVLGGYAEIKPHYDENGREVTATTWTYPKGHSHSLEEDFHSLEGDSHSLARRRARLGRLVLSCAWKTGIGRLSDQHFNHSIPS